MICSVLNRFLGILPPGRDARLLPLGLARSQGVRSQPLDRLLADGAFPSARVVAYGRQIAAGLAHAHGRGFLHRDLKAANIVVTENEVVKILDFGVARRYVQPEAETARLSGSFLDEPGTVAGTLAYMAPEALRG
jgi:serine/threonine protein kinase